MSGSRGPIATYAAYAALAVGALALLFWLTSVVWVPGRGLLDYRPEVVSGDEPHYLLMISSLLDDGDLELGDDYAEVAAGGGGAGRAFAGVELDHHTIVRGEGLRALWSELYDWRHPRRCAGQADCARFVAHDPAAIPAAAARGERPAHPPAYAFAVAGLLAVIGAEAELREHLAILTSTLAVWLTLLATWALARSVGLGAGGALAAVGVVVASPLTAYARGLFSEPLAALALTLGAWQWCRGRGLMAGLCWALATWIKPPWLLLALPAAAWALPPERWPRWLGRVALGASAATAWPPAAATAAALHAPARRLLLSLVPGVAALVGFNLWTTGGPIVSGQLGWRSVASLTDLPRTFIDPAHGLLLFAPWTAAALWSLWLGWRRADAFQGGGAGSMEHGTRRLVALGPAFIAFALLLCVFGSLGELCFGPRLWLPLLPLVAVVAVRWAAAGPRRRAAALAAASIAGLCASLPGMLAWPVAWEQPAWSLVAMLR